MSQWKRTFTPTKGHYEIHSFLCDSSLNLRRLAANDFLLHVDIVRVGDTPLDPPLTSKFRVHDTTEFLAAIQAKVELLHAPRVRYWHDIQHEYLEVVDVTLLPSHVRVAVEPVSDNSAEMEIFKTLCRHLSIKDRRYRLKTYPHCFVGQEMVDYLVARNLLPPAPGQPTRRRDAVHFGNLLWSAGKLVHVVDPGKPFQDKPYFYRFLMDGLPPTTRERVQSHSRLRDVEEAQISITPYTWTRSVPSPQPLTVPENVVSVACGTGHCLVLTSEGFVFSWGAGAQGQLGHPDKECSALDTPCLVQALADSPIQAVYAGYHGSAAKGEGTFLTWGAINPPHCRAQPSPASLPVQRSIHGFSSFHVAEAAVGAEHMMVLLASDAPMHGLPPHTILYTWGGNDYAQLGHGSISQANYEPRAVIELEGQIIRHIACSRAASGALTAEGDLYVWGDNSDHRLSTFTAMAVLPQPHKLTQLLKPVEHFSMGRDFVVVLMRDGTLYLWGHPSSMTLPSPRQLSPDPECFVLPRGYREVKQVVAGEQHVLLLIMEASGTHHVLAMGASGEALESTEDQDDLYQELNVYARQVILLAAGGDCSAAIAVDDRDKILLAAAQGLYSLEHTSQRKKLLHFLQHDASGEVQERTRKQLWQGRQQRRNKLVRSLEQRMLRTGGPLDRQCFELFQSSSVHSVRVASYRILGEQQSAFKYISDDIVLVNEGLSLVHFTVQVPPPSSAFRLTVSPGQGVVARDEKVTLKVQAIALQSDVHEDLLTISLRGSKNTHEHYVWYRVEAEVKLQVPEIPGYQLEGGQRLGSGGSSVVSLLDLDGRPVAVKKFRSKGLSKEETDSFRNEILITANLQHPNVIECVGVCLEYPTLALVLEYMPLRDLGEYVREASRSRYATDYLVRLCMDVAEGMAYLHHRMVMHRDLKLDNILLHSLDASGGTPCAKLTDFGTSTMLAPSDTSCEVGTARYMPLEVLEPSLSLSCESTDPRSIDVYSYGITVWALWCKSIPYPECQFTAQIIDTLKLQQPLTFPTEVDVPEEVISLVHACCHPQPQERPDFENIISTLIQVAEGMPSLNEPVSHLIQARGGSRALVVRTKESIVRYQMETIDKKLHRLQSKEVELQEQMRQLESTLTLLRGQRQQFVSERKRLNDYHLQENP